jgi:hypothetical protein
MNVRPQLSKVFEKFDLKKFYSISPPRMTWAQLSSTVIIALLSSISGQVFMEISHLESDLNMKTNIKN